ncbi:MAG: hypothetical protein R3E79_25475 [Caldilineaceae bacterium]
MPTVEQPLVTLELARWHSACHSPSTLHRVDGEAIIPLLHAQVDTGAEMTMVPAHYLQPMAADFL